MMSRFASHFHIMCAPWQQRRTEKSYGFIATIVLLLIVMGGVIGFLKGGDSQSMMKSYAALTAGSVVVFWLLQIIYMTVLNSPIHARLVPGHVRKLRQTFLAFWLSTSVAFGLIIGLVFADFVKWSFFAAIIEVICVTSLIWPWRWLFACIGLAPPWWPREALLTLFRKVLHPIYVSWPILSLTFLLLPCGYIITHKLIQSGGAKHFMDTAKSRRMRLSMAPDAQGRQASLHHLGSKGTLVMNIILYPLHRYMQHLLKKPQANTAHVMARAELVFAADAHWVMQASYLLGITLVALAIGTIEVIQHGFVWRSEIMEGSGLVALFMLIFGASAPLGIKQALLRSRREQALLTLLPAMPRGTALNRLIAGRLLRQCAFAWVFSVAVATQLQYLDNFGSITVAAYAAILPAFALLIQDWSKLETERPLKMITYMVLMVLWAIACYEAMEWLLWPPLAVGSVSALVGAVLLAWRWRKIATFPSAFPAGRFAPT